MQNIESIISDLIADELLEWNLSPTLSWRVDVPDGAYRAG